MQHNNALHSSYIEPEGPGSGADDPEALVVLEWAVPTAAKVPASRRRGPLAIVLLRPASVSSTAPAKIITELRANNNILLTSWCTTATLTAVPTA